MRVLFAILLILSLSGCLGGQSDPEPFAREVVAAVAAGDFSEYWALSSQMMGALMKSDSRVPGQGLGASLEGAEQSRVRGEFDRVVRSNRIHSGNFSSLQLVVVATELNRWTFEAFDADGRGVGVQIAIRSWNDGYRLLRAYPVPPGRSLGSVPAVEG